METMTVGDLKEALKDMKDWMPVFIVSEDEVFDVVSATKCNADVSLSLNAPDIFIKLNDLQDDEQMSAQRAEDAELDLQDVKYNVRMVIEDLRSSVAALEDWSR